MNLLNICDVSGNMLTLYMHYLISFFKMPVPALWMLMVWLGKWNNIQTKGMHNSVVIRC